MTQKKLTKYKKILKGYRDKINKFKKIAKDMENALNINHRSKLLPFELGIVQGNLNDKVSKKKIMKKYDYTQSELNEILKRLKILENAPNLCSNEKSTRNQYTKTYGGCGRTDEERLADDMESAGTYGWRK